MRKSVTILGFLAALFAIANAADYSAEQLDFFERKIRPVLAENCYECHSATGKKLKGGLQLDHRDHMLDGGDTDVAIVPGDPAASLLIETIAYDSPDLEMPPSGPLPDEVVEDFRKWIADGAAWPDEELPIRGGGQPKKEVFDLQGRYQEHWSWRPIEKPAVPTVNRVQSVVDSTSVEFVELSQSTKADNSAKAESTSPIDAFIQAKVAAAGLTSAKPADKRTLARRAYFDLIGLPPSVEQLDAFLADESPQAYQTLIDELLASPHFGEKWARHWMDLMRYAETYGHEFDYPIAYAHEYRDYLIRAFNSDLPYDQFLTEHVAGDLITEPRRNPEEDYNESILGTGFWYFNDATHAPTDVLANESDHMDTQIDVFGKAFLGLTISCARCHDHKFDAISTADYYALTTYLHSSARQDYPMDPGRVHEQTAQELKTALAEGDKALRQIPQQVTDKHRPGAYFLAAAELMTQHKAESQTGGDPWQGTLYEDFESGEYGEKWKPSGAAFGKAPAAGPLSASQKLSGQRGNGLANSFFDGSDRHRGTLTSQPFTIEHPYINFLIAGGKHASLGLHLLIDGQTVSTTHGENSDEMKPATINVSAYIGKSAQLKIEDNFHGGWGHIEVDHIVFSDTPADQPKSLAVPAFDKITEAAKAKHLDPDLLAAWAKTFSTEQTDTRRHPQAYLALLMEKPDTANSYANMLKGERNNVAKFQSENTKLFDFAESADGWSTTGFAFQHRPNAIGLSLEPGAPFSTPGTMSSAQLGEQQIGALRSPTIEISEKQIHVLAKSEKLFARVVMDNYHMGKFHTLLFNGTVMKNHGTAGEFQWFSFNRNLDKYVDHKAFLEFVDEGGAVVEVAEVWSGMTNPPKGYPHAMVEAMIGEGGATLQDSATNLDSAWDKAWQAIRTGKGTRSQAELLNWLVANDLLSIEKLSAPVATVLADAHAKQAKLPRPRYAIAMAEGTPEGGHVYVRGSYRKLGEPVAMRNLTALGGKGGDRLELSQQLTSRENPLVARVITNRVWHHLFGRGIVPTTDDFGPMGKTPSHPELLDWLAADFADNGWSVKQLIRSIMLSDTYRQSSQLNAANDPEMVANIDPDNVLLHKMPVRRLQAEAIRDSVLSVSGRLDSKLFGPSIATHRTAYMTGRGGRGSGPLDGAGRRSIYGAVYRNFLSPFMLTFDQPSPFGPKGRRSVSNVPAQSLVLMNDPFVIEQAKLWAKNTTAKGYTDPETRIRDMYEVALGAEPSTDRVAALAGFLDTQAETYGTVDDRAWTDLAHVLINMKDFIYLR